LPKNVFGSRIAIDRDTSADVAGSGGDLGGHVALFVLLLVGVVVTQTWLDWRDAKKAWVIPEWAKGVALGGVIAVSIAASTSVAAVWLRDDAGQWTDALSSRLFWPELVFLLCAMGILVVMARKKWLRLMLLLAGVLVAAFWLGMTL
jgi:hypothetical protein